MMKEAMLSMAARLAAVATSSSSMTMIMNTRRAMWSACGNSVFQCHHPYLEF
jgi:hypothetical protein